MSNIARAEAFFVAWNRRDLDAIMGFFAEDAFYHNIPMVPLRGRSAIRAGLEKFVGMAREIDWITHQIAETADGAVLSERTDRFLIGESWLEIGVMGVMQFDGAGQITIWKDYFDLGQFQAQMAAITPGG